MITKILLLVCLYPEIRCTCSSSTQKLTLQLWLAKALKMYKKAQQIVLITTSSLGQVVDETEKETGKKRCFHCLHQLHIIHNSGCYVFSVFLLWFILYFFFIYITILFIFNMLLLVSLVLLSPDLPVHVNISFRFYNYITSQCFTCFKYSVLISNLSWFSVTITLLCHYLSSSV